MIWTSIPTCALAALVAISPQGIRGVTLSGSTITLAPSIAPETFKGLVTILGRRTYRCRLAATTVRGIEHPQ